MRPTRTVTAIAAFVTYTGDGCIARKCFCARSIERARSYLWTLPVTRFPYTQPRGTVTPAQIFVAVLGASNYTYAEAAATQGLADWISAHIHTFEFLGGVPEILVPDNLKSGVTKACRYEPSVNRTYQEMAAHYGGLRRVCC